MAKVEMDLTELKQLKQQIKDLQLENKTIIENQQQVIIHHKYYDGKIRIINKDNKVNITGIKTVWDSPYTSHNEYFSETLSIQQLYDKGIIDIDFTEKTSKITKDYKNFNEIILDIKKEEHDNIKEEVNKFILEISKLSSENNTIKTKYETSIYNLKSEHNSKIEKVLLDHKKEVEKLTNEISKLTNKIDSIKNNKIELSK